MSYEKFDPHYIPCRKKNCVHLKVDSNQHPCNKCIVGMKWTNFKASKKPIDYDSKDFSFDNMVRA